MKKIRKTCLSLLSLLLVCLFFGVPVSASVVELDTASYDFFDHDTDFDYESVMSEPEVQVGTGSCTLSRAELKNLKLYPGGIPFGIKFMTEGVLIVGFCESDGVSSRNNPSNIAGLKIGDRIISVNGRKISSAAELSQIVNESAGKSLSMVCNRGKSSYSTTLTPFYSKSEGCYKTGVYVKDNGAGIGTVTYIVPGVLDFAGLGHGICEGDAGNLVPISRGSVVSVEIDGVQKGVSGTPGELKGHFKSNKCGTLLQNTDCGVFGIFASLPSGLPSAPLSLGLRDEIHPGKAHIYCTLSGDVPAKYEIEIYDIDRSSTSGKCFTVKVTDPALLNTTGGIVQGMSGSPIIQDGKLIGAVTHVLINDPTQGYGIFIENMLSSMNASVRPQAA